MGRRTAQTTQPANRTNPVPRWVAPGFALAAVCTVPWVVFLAASLPATSRVNDRLAWVGFDVGEVVMLAVTAYLAWRGKAKVALAATALATMLVVDAWFDVNTSTAGEDRDIALGFARARGVAGRGQPLDRLPCRVRCPSSARRPGSAGGGAGDPPDSAVTRTYEPADRSRRLGTGPATSAGGRRRAVGRRRRSAGRRARQRPDRDGSRPPEPLAKSAWPRKQRRAGATHDAHRERRTVVGAQTHPSVRSGQAPPRRGRRR